MNQEINTPNKQRYRVLSKTRLLITLVLLMTCSFTLQAQVTIGSAEQPSRATLLDLKTQQANGVVTDVGDENNITSDKGGLLLPRVKLVSSSSLLPFLSDGDPEVTTEFKLKLAGLMVYNIFNNGTDLYPNFYIWDGSSWGTAGINKSAQPMTIAAQPKGFTFYETGLELASDIKALEFVVNPPKDTNGAFLPVNYQWYMITGSNVHVRVGVKVTQGVGGTSANYAPTQIIKGTTKNAKNTGFYKFYCEASANGATVKSDVAEVAVGCGAKNKEGEWLSFMCFNLGADDNSTIKSQKEYLIGNFTNAIDGTHTYILGEENLYGDLFQWGRIPDGHEKRESSHVGIAGMTANDIVSGNRCGPVEISRPVQQTKIGSAWDGKFITSGSANNNSWTIIAQQAADQLWRLGRFIPNDPCAHYIEGGAYQEFWHEGPDETPNSPACTDAGTNWRAPSQEEWGSIYKGGTNTGFLTGSTANTWAWDTANGKGAEIKPDNIVTTLFLPASGYRSEYNANLLLQGSAGMYWSTSIIATSASAIYFSSASVYPNNTYPRARGLIVRCIKNT